MSFEYSWHLAVFGIVFVVAGLNHFRIPKFYERMIPLYWRYPRFLNFFSGLLEIVFGVMLFFSETKSLAAIGIIILLILFQTVHWYMIQERNGKFNYLPSWALYLRFLFQFVLIYWSYSYI